MVKGMEFRNILTIIHSGKVNEFKDEVEAIIKKIWAEGFPVYTTEYKYDESLTSWTIKGIPEVVRVRIKRDNLGLPVIWDLLHEYGHVLDGFAGSTDNMSPATRWLRETTAWHNAEKELEFYPRLQEHITEFRAYAEYCLNFYRDYLFKKFGYIAP